MSPILSNTMFEHLNEGDLVEFTYKQQSENYRWYLWRCTAVFISDKLVAPRENEVAISFRPKAGTSYIPKSNVTAVEVITPHTEFNKPHRDNDWGIKLPKKIQGGAVSAP